MKILTISTTNPIFIIIQYKSIKKFIKSSEEIEFVVFNDAKAWPDISNFNDINIKKQIEELCVSLGIKCINIPNDHHLTQFNASNRHVDSMNFITKYIIDNKDTYLIIDNDMFFVDNYDLNSLKDYYFAYVEENRIVDNKLYKYPWANLVYIDTNLAPNLDLLKWDLIKGLDVGGKAGGWLLTLDKSKIKKIQGLKSGMWSINNFPIKLNKNLLVFLENDPRNKNNTYFAELYDSKIFHYRGGSNWMLNSKKMHDKLTKLLYMTFEKL
jgi:hypothetical protein